VVPIGLSYILQALLGATPVQAFAAGAALCSTSLGTTFTVLGSSGLSSSRLGVVLTSAAMMDDVVGLVMVQVISNLGDENFNAITVVRPVLVSVAFAVVVPTVCLLVVMPITLWLNRYREANPTTALNVLLRRTQTAFAFHTVLLIALVTGATYAGTSNLFAGYIAGATISWWDSEVPHANVETNKQSGPIEKKAKAAASSSEHPPDELAGPSKLKNAACPTNPKAGAQDSQPTQPADSVADKLCGVVIYERYYHQAVSKILQPFFFASIGFSIPITRMFRGAIVWRGIVYTVLMAFAKIVCGLWLVRTSVTPMKSTIGRLMRGLKLFSIPHLWGKRQTQATSNQAAAANATEPPTVQATRAGETSPEQAPKREQSSPDPPKPISIHPPLIIAMAMCARGEIGFLISGVAESNGLFSPSGVTSSEPSDIFLVVTWAIVLCTIMGPFGVGLSVRRVKKLQERKNMQQNGTGRDVLGVWGVE
jgi:Kef-type K+ transport system membrane component KefB